ncbi:histidine phosphotransferase family protein [Hasllibacter sp. MH4015]|uniref:histidine phosphotransferase family protein n=1 Tax=Hasllibacter sp. MH4015 TaxID=2854029 RepID=UPI001CD37A0E|nr:histidine phosphotransferase family protein [Hasllibacter sp. MH4015]
MRDVLTDSSLSLADLVASRLCHDLVNPLGAIGNGVELLEMTGKADGPEVDLIRDAVRAAEARIRLFRLAFGGASEGQTTSQREAKQAVDGYFHQSRIDARWGATGDRTRQETKLAFLMLLCAESALPMGGSVSIEPRADGHWELTATGARLSVEESLWSRLRLAEPADSRPVRAAEAQFPLLLLAAEALGLTINYVADGDTLRMSTA